MADVLGAESHIATGYRGPAVCSIVGITYRQLDYWARTGMIVPARRGAGYGPHRRWTADDLRVTRVVAQLAALHGHGRHRHGAPHHGHSRPLPVDWPRLAALIRGHRTGWLLITPDQPAAITRDPDQVYRWQQTNPVTITIALERTAP